MERKEFLSLLSAGTASFLVMGCLGGCSKKAMDDPDMQPNQPGGGTNKTDFTFSLDDAGNASLKTKGNALVKNGVIVAHTNAGTYIAVAAACTHQGTTVEFQAPANRFHCPNHGSNFTETGAVINGPAGTPLKQFKTTLTGNNLRVHE
ncbi:Rieske (2Fe-2S) protein [soil metagenome]|jgi:cytochrome b6-f complex iron-sulfur subunit